MICILDVNAAFAYITRPDLQVQFRRVFEDSEQIIAPDVYIAEATNVAWQFHKIEGRDPEGCHILLTRSLSIVESFIPTLNYYEHALNLACQLLHPAYDCFYLALALTHSGTIFTFDKKLVKMAEELAIPVLTFDLS
ncbi:MAG: type II toxin-antitoxin system VapC family toxin [Bacteroidota bacterium]